MMNPSVSIRNRQDKGLLKGKSTDSYQFAVNSVRNDQAVLAIRNTDVIDDEIEGVWKISDDPDSDLSSGLL